MRINVFTRTVFSASLLFFCSFSDALALSEDFVPAPGDYIFYTFAFCGVVFSTLAILAYKEYKWLVYVVLSFLLIVNAAALDGSIAYLSKDSNFIVSDDFILWVLPFLLTTSIASYGYWIVALRMESPHPLARLKPAFFLLSALSALFSLSTFFWLEKIPLPTMWVPAIILFLGMIAGQILPPLTWPSYSRRLRLFVRVFPIIAAVFSIGGYWIYSQSADASQQDFNNLYRWSLLLFAFFSLTTVIWQAFNNTRMKESADRKAIEAAKNEAETKLRLVQAEIDYKEALSVAAKHRMQLATVSHDLKQPISALRVAADHLYRSKQADADKLAKAIDYIDSLSRTYASSDEIVADSVEPDDREMVTTGVLGDALQQMFTAEAEQKNIQISFISMNHSVVVEPLSAMRVMTNLVANALAHSGASRVLVGFRGKEDRVIFQVHDDGCGIPERMQSRLFALGEKGQDSEGQGLGLGIVQELCRAQEMDFTLRSKEGEGTSAYVEMSRKLSKRCELVKNGVYTPCQ